MPSRCSHRRVAHTIVAVGIGALALLSPTIALAAPQASTQTAQPPAADLLTKLRAWLMDAAIGVGVREQISLDDTRSRKLSATFVWRLPPGARAVSPAFSISLLPRRAAVTSTTSGDVIGSLGLRPLMAGASWRIHQTPRTSFSVSGLAGGSLNGVDADDRSSREPHRPSTQPVTAISNSLALEGGARLWFDVTPITSLSIGLSALRTRPTLTFQDGHEERWVADHLRLEAGIVVKVLRLFR